MRHSQLYLYLFTALLILSACTKKASPVESLPSFEELGLLTDEEMLTREDPAAPTENEAWGEWIGANAIPIRSLDAEASLDLEEMIPYLADKRIVQLGESGHGVREFSSVKVRLIKFLHQELGFNVIAFESSIYECFAAYRKIDYLNATELMQHSVFAVWHAWEVRELFAYIRSCRHTDNPLILSGFDIQPSAAAEYMIRPLFFQEVIAQLDSGYAEEVFALDSTFTSKMMSTSYIQNNNLSLLSQYQALVDFLDTHQSELANLYSDDPLVPLIARQTAWSMTQYIRQITASGQSRTMLRDKGMADNFAFLATNLYPGEKIIVWAHNFHIRHKNEVVKIYDGLRTMGSYVADQFGPDLYTIGLFMYRGQAALNDREIYDIEPARSGSLESIFYRARKKYCFIDLAGQSESEGNSWMFRNIYAKSWGLSDIKMVLRNQYSAILFIDTVHPPAYIEY